MAICVPVVAGSVHYYVRAILSERSILILYYLRRTKWVRRARGRKCVHMKFTMTPSFCTVIILCVFFIFILCSINRYFLNAPSALCITITTVMITATVMVYFSRTNVIIINNNENNHWEHVHMCVHVHMRRYWHVDLDFPRLYWPTCV